MGVGSGVYKHGQHDESVLHNIGRGGIVSQSRPSTALYPPPLSPHGPDTCSVVLLKQDLISHGSGLAERKWIFALQLLNLLLPV